MHRWFFADDEIFCQDSTAPPSPSETSLTCSASSSSPHSVSEAPWTFKVKFDWSLCCNETLAICGSCPSLGNWNPQLSLPLNRNENSIWSLTVSLPHRNGVRYRYLVIALNNRGEKIVRFWETHFEARRIHGDSALEFETFGLLNNSVKIERGWIHSDMRVVQLKFYQAPFVLKTNQQNQMLLQIKIVPIKLKAPQECESLMGNNISKGKQQGEAVSETFAFCEVACLQNQNQGTNTEFRKQAKYGIPCGNNDFILFNLTLDDIQHTAFLIDLYSNSPKSGYDVPPSHFGYQHILPQDLHDTEGTLELVIKCGIRHQPIGSMKCEYLVVKPMQAPDFNVEKTFQRHWNTKHPMLYIGHRGCGKSFWYQKNMLRENTIHSLNLAVEHGADMLEIDVQLTKDKVPILWHDFQLYVSERVDFDPQEYDIMNLRLANKELEALQSSGNTVDNDLVGFSLSRFTLEQLERTTVYEPAKDTVCASNTKNNRPFPTLEQVLKQVDVKTGLVIDIKWPQAVVKATKREAVLPDFDKNEFIDAILQVIFDYAGPRRIILSSFDADICAMVRLKQNFYPILFLILPLSSKKRFTDPRAQSNSTGANFALAMELLGVGVNCSDLLEVPGTVSAIHERKLCILSWGKEIAADKNRQYLKALGVEGIIYDRINHAVKPSDVKENIFHMVPLEEET